MSAARIAQQLGNARREGRGWRCRCPLHGGASLVVADGRDGNLLVKCWGGCDAVEILRTLRHRGYSERSEFSELSSVTAKIAKAAKAESDRNGRAALSIWGRTRSASATPAARYLRGRAITVPIPAAIRYSPDCLHTPSGLRLPAMIAAVTVWPSDAVVAIHRTYLGPNGSGKALVTQAKMTLGPISGGAVRLTAAGPTLGVGEGIETCLAGHQATGIPMWSALSAGGIEQVILPDLPLAQEVIIFADHDGRGIRAAETAAARWQAQGRRVRIALPPEPGTDFADLLCESNAGGGR